MNINPASAPAANSIAAQSNSPHASPSAPHNSKDTAAQAPVEKNDIPENTEARNVYDALFLESLNLDDETHLQIALQYLAQAFDVSVTLGIMMLLHYPTLKQACQRLSQDYQQALQRMPTALEDPAHPQPHRALAQRSVFDITSDALIATSSSTAFAASGLSLLPQAIKMPHVQRSLMGVSSFSFLLNIPFLLKSAWNNGSLACRTTLNFLNRDAEFQKQMDDRLNPANYFLQDIFQKGKMRANVNDNMALCVSELSSCICLLAGMGMISIAVEAGVKEGIGHCLNQGDVAALKGDEKYALEKALVPLIARLLKNLTADDMRKALKALGVGNHVQWQFGGAMYSDHQELAFLTTVFQSCAEKNSYLTDEEDCLADEENCLAGEKDCLQAKESIKNIYCDCAYPEFAMHREDGYVKNRNLRQFLILIRELRKQDLPTHGNNKRMGGPLGQNNNHVFRHVILPMIESNAFSVQRATTPAAIAGAGINV